jgi:hypothetical protein
MAVVVTERDETAKLGNIDEILDHERQAQVEIKQLLADLKDKDAIALEMIAILRGVRGPAARYDRKAARKALVKIKQRCTLAEQRLRRSQNRLKGLEEQSGRVEEYKRREPLRNVDERMMYPRRDEVMAGQQQFPWADPAGQLTNRTIIIESPGGRSVSPQFSPMLVQLPKALSGWPNQVVTASVRSADFNITWFRVRSVGWNAMHVDVQDFAVLWMLIEEPNVDKQSAAEKVLSVMPQGKAIRLSEITALSGFSQDSVLRILVADEWAGRVKRVQPDEETEAFWMRIWKMWTLLNRNAEAANVVYAQLPCLPILLGRKACSRSCI